MKHFSVKCEKDYSWDASTCICENSKYLKSTADTSVVEWDEIISVVDIASTAMTNTIATNVTKKVRDFYILHTVLLAVIITIICY